MFEGFVASILNKWLGRYVEDLDTEQLNVGIFSGEVRLNNLKLKPEALFELKLPIEVKFGVIGHMNLIIPWNSFASQAIEVTIEEVLIVCTPVGVEGFSPERERRLIRALKKRILDDLEGENFLGCSSESLFNGLLKSLTNSVQIFIRKIHVRYEDVSCINGIACGVCVESISLETTNSKWKASARATGSATAYHLAKVEAASVYLNTDLEESDFLKENWRQCLIEGLGTFSIRGKAFDFVIKPFSVKVKSIVSRSTEAGVPKLLVDLVIHDIVCNLSRAQLQSVIVVMQNFHQINLKREFLSFRPTCPITRNVSLWWKYSCEAVLRQRIRPYKWENIQKHRANYHECKKLYKMAVLNPNDTELWLDLARAEDNLPLSSIIIARERGKVEIRNEEPDRIEVISSEKKWWSFHESNEIRFQVRPEKPRGIWLQLSPSERRKLTDLEALDSGTAPQKYIEHKVNLTIHHLTGSIFVRGNEIASTALGHFLVSFESRPTASAFKVSARAESFVLESASGNLSSIPIISVATTTGDSSSNFLHIDFEKNPASVEADYGITINLEQIEVIYHENFFSDFVNFFQGLGITSDSLRENFSFFWSKLIHFKTLIDSRQIRIDLNTRMKAPNLIIPKNGCLTKSGMMAIIGLGTWSLHTDLQPPLCLDDVTQTELEERLYDRFYINVDGFQVLFGGSGGKMREALNQDESEFHVLTKVRSQVILSSSIKPDYRLLPKSKLNVMLYNVKINLSDRRVVMLLDYTEGLSLPSSNIVAGVPIKSETPFINDTLKPDVELDLKYLKKLVVFSELSRQRTPDNSQDLPPEKVPAEWSSSEVSDEDVELWARTVDLPGFDDNISPNNTITYLFRLIVGEMILVLSRSSDTADKPYLMARVSKCRLDSAFMNYGPAVQATVGGIQLIDKLHTGHCGEYLEIISTQSDFDFISLLYRKVRSDCPEFKSYFHNVEQSLVLDIGVLAVNLHREAILTFTKYLQYLGQKLAHKEMLSLVHNKTYLKSFFEKFETKDPPIPPGAIKFSYSTHLTEFRLRLCDTEFEFLELKVKGFESDCMFKANERMILRAYLSHVSLDDLSDVTIYPKIISVEEDRVFEMKYVRHSPRLYNKGLESGKDDVHTDGSLKLNFERIHLVVVYKMMVNLQHFIEPLIPVGVMWQMTGFIRRNLSSHINQLKGWNARLHLSFNVHLPVVLLPQKNVSSNLLVINLGDLVVENFFKELGGHANKEEKANVIDNILFKLDSVSLSRGSMTLTGNLVIRGNILEPIRSRFDVKRFVGGSAAMLKVGPTNKCREIPVLEMFGVLEPVKISFGQKDLLTFLSICRDNFSDKKFLEPSWWNKSVSPIDGRSPMENEELFVRKLQVFLSQGDACRKDTVARFIVESVTVDLYNDIGEDLSSPVRDSNQGFCRLTLWEASSFLEKYYDGSMEIKIALQTCLMEDTRIDPSVAVKKVFQCLHGDVKKFDSSISVSTPPMVDVMFKQTQAGDRCVDILVEKTRLNLSVSFLTAFIKFGVDSTPVKSKERGFVNHGYTGDVGQQGRESDGLKIFQPPSSVDSTSGYYSSGMSCAADEHSGLSVSLRCRKPELVVLATREGKTSAILFQCEFLADWSRHPGRDALVVSLAGLQACSKTHSDSTLTKQKSALLLHQCDVEIDKNVKSIDDGTKISIKATPIEIRLSVITVATVAEIIRELRTKLFAEVKSSSALPPEPQDLEDLWSPKKIPSYCDADICAAGEPLLQQPSFPVNRPFESLFLNVPKIQIVFEIPLELQRRPLLLIGGSIKLSAYDWSSSINLRGELQIQAAYFNEDIGMWEPFIEPCNNRMNAQRPWELVLHIFQGKSFPISPHVNFKRERSSSKERKLSNHLEEPENSETSGDESDPGMVFLKRQKFESIQKMKNQNFSLGCGDSSDSEGEEGALEKLTNAVGYLFTGANSNEDVTGSADTSATDDEDVEEEVETEETESSRSPAQERAVFLKKHSDSIDSGLETEAVERFAVHALIYSKDRLEISVTPLSVKVLQEISHALSGSSALPKPSFESKVTVKNSLGPGSVITMLSTPFASGPPTPILVAHYDRDDSPPSSPGSSCSNRSCSSGYVIDFNEGERNENVQREKLSPIFQYPKESVSRFYDRITQNQLLIRVPGFNDLKVVAPRISCSKSHVLYPSRNQTWYHIILNTTCFGGFRKYSIRSPLQVHNGTSYALEAYYKKSVLESLNEKVIGGATNPFDDLVRLAVIEPDDILDVPLFVAYHCKLHFAPAHVSTYHVSENGVAWQEILSEIGIAKDLWCSSKRENDPKGFSIKASCKDYGNSYDTLRPPPVCVIRLLSPMVVYNFLPYMIEIKLPQAKHEVKMEAGDETNIYCLNLQKQQKIVIEVPDYQGILWTGSFNLTADTEEKILTMTTEQETDGGNKQLSLSVSITRNPTINIQVHSPYWILNKTGLPLQIRGSLTDCIHEWSGDGPMLFGFRKQRRRCIRLRAFNSSWSSAFSLDTPGCSGLAICKDKERRRRYRILVQSHLSQTCPKLTKIISLLPNFIVTNSCTKHLRFMEDNEKADLWVDLAPGQCLPFWPETDSMRMSVKFRDSKHVSQHFPITISHTTVLRMDKGCGITVEVNGIVDQPFSIRFQNYKPGDAPVRIDNRCEDLFLKFHQKDSGQVDLLSPHQSLLYTWDDPSKERSLLWNVYNNKGKDFVVPFWKDGFGEEKVTFQVIRRGRSASSDKNNENHQDKNAVHKKMNASVISDACSSSSSDDSEERTIKPQLAKKTRCDKITVYWASYLDNRQRVLLLTQDERISKKIKATLDAERSQLELFVSIAGIGVSLINKNKEEIPREVTYFSLSDSAAQWEVTVAHRWKTIELELASWLEDKYMDGLPKTQIKDYIHVDFEKMQMTKPFFGELRRKHRPAIWIQYRRSKHMSLFHFQLHRLQIDNQLHDAEFPTIVYPVPPPPTTFKYTTKPSLEVAYLKKHAGSSKDVYKFVKFVVQEHKIQLERSWLSEMSNFWALWLPQESHPVKIRHDIALVHLPISATPAKSSSNGGNESMFEYLHCSPIKLQITFSSRSEQNFKEINRNPTFDYFVYTLAPSFAQVKTITIKLLCFEVIGQLSNKDFIWDHGVRHFASQFWQQIHVLVTGTNVLTNPYFRFLDFSDDSHPLFYEPYLENMGVPEEFSEGISLSALGLLGHETGGPSGTKTLFATLLGTAVQNIIHNEEAKKKSGSVESAKDFPELIMQSFSNFSSVCPLALSGVVMTQNMADAPSHGVENFFKSTGKGLMALMTKSTGVTLNCLSITTDGMKRATEMGCNVICRTRPPRYINPILGLRPYNSYEAQGLTLLKIICKGLHGNDTYWAHADLTIESKTILLVTLQHVFLIGKHKCWGSYEPIWILKMDDLMAVPTIQDDKLIFNVRQDKGSTTVWNEEKIASSSNNQLLQWLKNEIEAALVLSMEDKPCP